MEDTYYAGSYWLARHEPAEACARRAEMFFKLLQHCDSAWSHWHEAADSFEEARERRVSTDAASFERMFARKERRIGDGFSYWLWAGDNSAETSVVNGSCGSSSPWVPSSCVLTPPWRGPVSERVLTATVMAEVLCAMALAWEPEWGVATSQEHLEQVTPPEGYAEPGNFVGWVMYFSNARGVVPPLPAPVRVEPVEDKGTLVILTPERFAVAKPEHTALASRVHSVLQEAGLLRAVIRP